jgi:alkanesulfonate monooxygenase SsuD/methylene tetrahydromethanopterin reductase-like flavin-dependent oxidoreductase (luciferase family)
VPFLYLSLKAEERPRLMKLGFNTLGHVQTSRSTGRAASPAETLESIIEQGVLTEKLGLSAFSIGEHHGDPAFVTSSPPVLLATIAARTESIRLMTGVTLLPLLDPVRVAEDYATLDHVSHGRADIVAGKGNFSNASRLLVGDNEPDRSALMQENLELLLEIFANERITSWEGTSRPPLTDAQVTPRPFGDTIPIWMGATRNLDSIELAARHGLAVLIAGFRPGSYRDFADHYRDELERNGYDRSVGRVASLSVVAVGHDETKVRSEFIEHLDRMKASAAARDPRVQRIASQDSKDLIGPEGQMLVGTPEYIAERLILEHKALGQELHLLQVDHGSTPSEAIEAMHMLAEEVIPTVLRETESVPAS